MTRALLLETPHPIADEIFAKFSIEVTRVTGALSEDDLIDALEGIDYVGLRSKTEVTERGLRARMLSAAFRNVMHWSEFVGGDGVVVDLDVLFEELEDIASRGVDCSRLLISSNAHIIPPYNRLMDQANERARGNNLIGTTGRGIGPTYADKMNRIGLRIQDLFHPEELRAKVEAALAPKNTIFEAVDIPTLDPAEVSDHLLSFADRVKPMLCDASVGVNDALDRGDTVLFEGGQATMLDIDHGTYPFVTSSNCLAGGASPPAGATRQVLGGEHLLGGIVHQNIAA